MSELDVVSYLAAKGHHGRAAGGDEVAYPCFFHCAEPDGSRKRKLYVNTAEAYYTCFVCGESGGSYKLQKHFGDTPETPRPGEDPHVKRRILTWATEVGAAMLANSDEQMLALLRDRGLSPETIIEAKIGWVGNGWSLTKSLPEEFSRDELVGTGLVHREGRRLGDDFFYDHLLIPYVSRGSVVQLRGRATHNGQGGKYLTGPGEPVRMFGTDSLDGAEDAIIVEGEFDALALRQHLRTATDDRLRRTAVLGLAGANGFKTGFESYLADIKRIYLALDPDDTGRREAVKIKERLGARAKLVELPAELPKCDWSEFLLPVPVDADGAWHGLHPHSGHGWRDVAGLLGKAAGRRVHSIRDAGTAFRKQRENNRGFKTGFTGLDQTILPGGLPGQVCIVLAKTGTGKGHPLDTEVPTPQGFRRWGELVVGDSVLGSDGRATLVTGVHDRGELACYSVGFSDRSSVLVDGEHLWPVAKMTGHARQERTVATRELGELKHTKRTWRYQLALTEPVDYPAIEAPVDPYVLGQLLVNGSLMGEHAVAWVKDPALLDRLPGAERWFHPHDDRFRLPAEVLRGIRTLKLTVPPERRQVPACYLTASVGQRIALLHGLLDAGGFTHGQYANRVGFEPVSPALGADLIELVNSLGGTAAYRLLQHGLRERQGAVIEIALPASVPPFTRRSSKDNVFSKSKQRVLPERFITEVTPQPSTQIRCITVAAPDQLYLIGRSYTLTHNTVFLCNLAYNQRAHRILFISLEMTREEVYDRMARIYRFHHPLASNHQVEEGLANVFICDENRLSDRDFEQVLDEFTTEVGDSPEIVYVDYLGYYARGQKGNSQYEKMTNGAMQLKAMAKSDDPAKRFFLVSPAQVNRGADSGKPIDLDDARDSGAIEETADFLLALWRPDDALNLAGAAQPTGNVRCGILKSRHGGKDFTFNLKMDLLTLALVDAGSPDAARADRHNTMAWRGTTYDELRAQETSPVQMMLGRTG